MPPSPSATDEALKFIDKKYSIELTRVYLDDQTYYERFIYPPEEIEWVDNWIGYGSSKESFAVAIQLAHRRMIDV